MKIDKMEKDELTYHVPVLLKESVDGMNIHPDGTYVDVTFGGAGHSREILSRLGEGGRLLGFPTANVAPTPTMLPKPGVYVTLATPSESAGSGLPFVFDPAHPTPNTYPAVTNIGYNPTFGPGALTVETHLLDFDADLYGKHL